MCRYLGKKNLFIKDMLWDVKEILLYGGKQNKIQWVEKLHGKSKCPISFSKSKGVQKSRQSEQRM